MIKEINFDNGETEHLQFMAVDHEYTRLSGEVIPSATEILNIISKPALTFWAASEAGKYFREKIIPCDKLADTNIKLPCLLCHCQILGHQHHLTSSKRI